MDNYCNDKIQYKLNKVLKICVINKTILNSILNNIKLTLNPRLKELQPQIVYEKYWTVINFFFKQLKYD